MAHQRRLETAVALLGHQRNDEERMTENPASHEDSGDPTKPVHDAEERRLK
jgi:hypothetical protein